MILLLPLAAAIAAAQPAEAPPPPEHLVVMPLPGLVARTQERPGVTQTDWLAPGHSFDHAPRVVTIERIAGAAGPEAPMRFIAGLTTCFRPCPAGRNDAIDQAPVGGRPAARVTIEMPPNAAFPGPRRVFALAISGDRDLHTVTVLIRGPVSQADADFAEAVLRSATLCTAGLGVGVCR